VSSTILSDTLCKKTTPFAMLPSLKDNATSLGIGIKGWDRNQHCSGGWMPRPDLIDEERSACQRLGVKGINQSQPFRIRAANGKDVGQQANQACSRQLPTAGLRQGAFSSIHKCHDGIRLKLPWTWKITVRSRFVCC
jgi:hypothetical protein